MENKKTIKIDFDLNRIRKENDLEVGTKRVYNAPYIIEIGKINQKTKGKSEGFGDIDNFFQS